MLSIIYCYRQMYKPRRELRRGAPQLSSGLRLTTAMYQVSKVDEKSLHYFLQALWCPLSV